MHMILPRMICLRRVFEQEITGEIEVFRSPCSPCSVQTRVFDLHFAFCILHSAFPAPHHSTTLPPRVAAPIPLTAKTLAKSRIPPTITRRLCRESLLQT